MSGISRLLQNLFSRSTWRIQVLGPVIVVVIIWVVMSVVTTFYLGWVEAFYDRVFSGNLPLISAAHSAESLTWQTLGEWNDSSVHTDEFQRHWEGRQEKLDSILQQLARNAKTEDEQQAENELRRAKQQLSEAIETDLNISRTTGERNEASSQRLRELVTSVSLRSAEFRKLNENLIEAARAQLASTHSIVVFLRTLMLLLGPLLGVFLGWRVAGRLQSSVSQIAVTLSSSGPQDTSKPNISESSFDEVRQQAERVVDRLRLVGLELQSARKEIIQSERLAAVGELAAGVAHELRNPLTSVKLLLQHASRKADAFRIEEQQLHLILDEVARMESTIQGLLDFSRTPTLNRSCHDLRETLQRSINLVDGRLRQEKVQLRTRICAEPALVDGDAEQLNQVFVNLLLNSVEAMQPGGTIQITLENHAPRRQVQITVEDSGTGIASDVMSRLFEPFATTKERGTGLGLAISHRIITEHLGSIVAENLPGEGAKFVVLLPMSSGLLPSDKR